MSKIPDLVVRGQAKAWSELDYTTPLDPQTYTVVIPALGSPRDDLEARDAMVEALVLSGNKPEYARSVADRAAIQHDRKRG